MSLRWRITLLVIALLATVLVGAGWSLARVEAREFDRELEARMRGLAFSGLRQLRPRPGPRGMPDRPPSPEDAREVELEAQPEGAHAEVLFYGGPPHEPPRLVGRAATGTPRLDAAMEAPSFEEPDLAIHEVERAGTVFYVLRARMGGGRGRLPGGMQAVVFLEKEPVRAVLTGRLRRAATIGLLALVLGAALAYLLAGRMLRPVRRAADAAEAIDAPDQRLPRPAHDDELGRLVNVLNDMLGRLEAGATRERAFLATASHELRRPLAALRGEIELALRADRPATELRLALERSLGDAQAMGRLVDDLLQHARSRAGADPLTEEDVDLVDLIDEAVERSRRALLPRVRLDVRTIPEVTIRGDRLRLLQIVENLLINAGTHGGEDPHVVLEARVAKDGLSLTVEDDGEGIEPEALASIFEPFGRGDRTRSVPGSGLGLAIAKDGAEAHGGSIEVTSPVHQEGGPARGALFTVRLPAARLRGA